MNRKEFYTLLLLLVAELTFAQSSVKYEYDEMNRLTRVSYSNGTTVSYTYDELGNRTAKEVTGGSAPIVENAEPYAVLSDGNTLLTFYYDDQKEARGGMDVNGFAWFREVSSITTVVFDPSFAYCKTITTASPFFYNCSKLTRIIGIENLKTDHFVSMDDMFYNCGSLESVDISHFNTENVTSMARTFLGCSSLKSLDVSRFDTEHVTDMSCMFSGCSSLSELDVTKFNTKNVKNMFGMFMECSSLTSIDVTPFNTSQVSNMAQMFYGCTSLTILDLTNLNNGNVKAMSYMFASCTNLKTIYCNETWNPEESNDMFYGCLNLKGAISYDKNSTNSAYANPDTGYFTKADLASKLLGSMVTVDGGTFTMGATDGWGYEDERPVHEVTLPTFTISKYEVTQRLWKEVMGDNPSTFTGDELPVNNVSWNECQAFISKLNQLTGLIFALPTEAEWEFAARGGIQANDKGSGYGYQYAGGYDNIESMGSYVWYSENSEGTTHAVGTKLPNELGLYDMSGNVGEYVDDYFTSAYGAEPVGDTRVYRGGSYQRPTWQCRLASRFGNSPDTQRDECGLRLVLRKNGDANADGMVNANDIVEVVNYIAGKPSSRFSMNLADANKDGVVNSLDIDEIVRIIMRQE